MQHVRVHALDQTHDELLHSLDGRSDGIRLPHGVAGGEDLVHLQTVHRSSLPRFPYHHFGPMIRRND